MNSLIRRFLLPYERTALDLLAKPGYVVALKSEDGTSLTEVRFRGHYRMPKGARQSDLERRTYTRQVVE